MSNHVYYIPSDLPIPLTLALHAAILEANGRCSGKTLHEHHVVVKDVAERYDGHDYDGVVTFHDWPAYNMFKLVCSEQGFSINENLRYETKPYINTRVRLQQDNDGHLSVWTHYRDACVHLTGDEVNPKPIIVSGESNRVVITDVIIAGDNTSVNKTVRRYKHSYMSGWATTLDWEYVAAKLRHAEMYLVTDKGLLIAVTPAGMKWQRMTKHLHSKAKQAMCVAGYRHNAIKTTWAIRRAGSRVDPNPFTDSIREMLATETYELKR